MGKYVMVVQSRAKEGRDDEYNEWYDNIHFADVCTVPGVKSGRRLESVPGSIGPPGLRYLALYEVEADDPNAVLDELQRRSADGMIGLSDALDAEAAILWMYKLR